MPGRPGHLPTKRGASLPQKQPPRSTFDRLDPTQQELLLLA
jgi:hypothetical protein